MLWSPPVMGCILTHNLLLKNIWSTQAQHGRRMLQQPEWREGHLQGNMAPSRYCVTSRDDM